MSHLPPQRPPPAHELLAQLRLVSHYAGRLDRVQRFTPNADNDDQPETVALHTLRLALSVTVLLASSGASWGTIGKAVVYALVHDLPEMKTGDVPTLGGLSPEMREAKAAKEAEAIRAIREEMTAAAPTSGHVLTDLVSAYEAGNGMAAELVHLLDKVLPSIEHERADCAKLLKEGWTEQRFVEARAAQLAALRKKLHIEIDGAQVMTLDPQHEALLLVLDEVFRLADEQAAGSLRVLADAIEQAGVPKHAAPPQATQATQATPPAPAAPLATDEPEDQSIGIERLASMGRAGDDARVVIAHGLPPVGITAALEINRAAGQALPGEGRHIAYVTDDGMEREFLTLPVQPRKVQSYDVFQALDDYESAAYLLPGDQREAEEWGSHAPRHVVELWRGVCPNKPDWLSDLCLGGWLKDAAEAAERALDAAYSAQDGSVEQRAEDLRRKADVRGEARDRLSRFVYRLPELLYYAWNPLVTPWELGDQPVLTLAQPLAPHGLVLGNLDGRNMGERREEIKKELGEGGRWRETWRSCYDAAWFKTHRPRPLDPRFLPPDERPADELMWKDTRSLGAHPVYEPSVSLPGGWIPTFQSVVIVELTVEALKRAAPIFALWPDLLGLSFRLTTAAQLTALIDALIGVHGRANERLPASWRFAVIDDATEPMDLGQLIGDASCDDCLGWFWAETPRGTLRWETGPDGEVVSNWTGPELAVADYGYDGPEDEPEEEHDEELEFESCPLCGAGSSSYGPVDPHWAKQSSDISKARLSAVIWDGAGAPPDWLSLQIAASQVPLLLGSHIPQAHVRGLVLHPPNEEIVP